MRALIIRPLSTIVLAASLGLGPVSGFAQSAGEQTPVAGNVDNQRGPMGGQMKGGAMKGGPMGGDNMAQMMRMMHERLAHAGERVEAVKTELKITDAQLPAWNKFADTLVSAAKAMDETMKGDEMKMIQSGGEALPERLDGLAKMASKDTASLQAIKAALDPLYATFNDEQKKIADGMRIGPMGLM